MLPADKMLRRRTLVVRPHLQISRRFTVPGYEKLKRFSEKSFKHDWTTAGS